MSTSDNYHIDMIWLTGQYNPQLMRSPAESFNNRPSPRTPKDSFALDLFDMTTGAFGGDLPYNNTIDPAHLANPSTTFCLTDPLMLKNQSTRLSTDQKMAGSNTSQVFMTPEARRNLDVFLPPLAEEMAFPPAISSSRVHARSVHVSPSSPFAGLTESCINPQASLPSPPLTPHCDLNPLPLSPSPPHPTSPPQPSLPSPPSPSLAAPLTLAPPSLRKVPSKGRKFAVRKPYTRTPKAGKPAFSASPLPLTPTLHRGATKMQPRTIVYGEITETHRRIITPFDARRILKKDLKECAFNCCRRKFKNKTDLIRHEASHEPPRYACVGVPFHERAKVGLDIADTATIWQGWSDEPRVGGCGLSFSRDDALLRHWRVTQKGCVRLAVEDCAKQPQTEALV